MEWDFGETGLRRREQALLSYPPVIFTPTIVWTSARPGLVSSNTLIDIHKSDFPNGAKKMPTSTN